jgi:hypothetical protein
VASLLTEGVEVDSDDRSLSVIAPGLTLADVNAPITLDDCVLVFEKSIEGWLINIAGHLEEKVDHSGFAVLAILSSLPETIWQYRNGKCSRGHSCQAFAAEMKLIFPAYDRTLFKLAYDRIRNGLYHSGLTKPGVALSGAYDEAIELAPDGGLVVNPHRWPEAFRSHLHSYTSDLRNPANHALRENFQRRCQGSDALGDQR